MSDLYFIANPALGLVKIGIAQDVDQRRRTLECGCGVSLEVLGICRDGSRYEKDLHDAFMQTRLLGEWFEPSEELLTLAANPSSVPAYVAENAERIKKLRMVRDTQISEDRAAHEAAERAHREEVARVKREAKEKVRLANERAEKRRRAREKKEAERVEAERKAWEARHAAQIARVVKPEAAEKTARRRLELTTQRSRNAALLGIEPLAGAANVN